MMNKEMNLQRFGGWDEVMKEPASSNKTNYVKLKDGMNKLRILDNAPTSRWTHWLNAQKRRITCLGAKECPFCRANKEAKEAGAKGQPFPVSMRFSMNVINRETNQLEILDQGRDFFKSLHDIHSTVGDLTTYDLMIKTTNAGTKDVNHTPIPSAPMPLTDEEIAMIADKRDLSEVFKAPTVEQAEMLAQGKSADEVFGGNKSNDEDEKVEVE